jgi:hypothetical protein
MAFDCHDSQIDVDFPATFRDLAALRILVSILVSTVPRHELR